MTVALSGYFFEKTVADLTSGVNPATTAAPGDKLRYTLRFRTTNQALNNFRIFDDMDALNAQADFAPGTLTLVTSPAGADISATSSTGGTKGTGVIDIRNLSLPVNGEVLIQFDITLKPAIANGTVVTNQAALFDNGTTVVSDDPNVNGTADPTRVTIVSTAALLYAEKRVALFSDLGSPGIVDPGDVLRYTITVQNSGAIAATGVVLTDPVPANTTYVANSTLAQRIAGRPAGWRRLAARLGHQHRHDRARSRRRLLQFDLRVNPGTPAGTVISNQAVVSSVGAAEPADRRRRQSGDGPRADSRRGGCRPAAFDHGTGLRRRWRRCRPRRAAGLRRERRRISAPCRPTTSLSPTISTRSQPGQLAYVNRSATMNGSAAGVSFAGSTITANYGAVNGPLAPGAAVVLRFRATLNSNLALGTVVTNTAVVAWNNPTQTASASVSIVVGSHARLRRAERVCLARRQLRRCSRIPASARWLAGRWNCTG